jgi:single-strand DNA-binding protein
MASKSLNRVVLMGNLTRDPELKYTPQGTAVCTFGLATNRGWTTATGEIKEDVQYHRIVAWQKLAELCAQLLKKGRKVYLEGRIVYRTYTGKDGQERQSTEIIMSDFIVFDDRRTGDTVTMPTHEKTKTDDAEFSVEDLAAIDSEAEDTSKITSDDMPF